MVTVGTRELKNKLSYYLQLMQSGEEVAITIHRHVVGYLSRLKSPFPKKKHSKTTLQNKRKMALLKEKWIQEGFLLSPGDYVYRPFKPVSLKKSPLSSEIIRSLRDETL